MAKPKKPEIEEPEDTTAEKPKSGLSVAQFKKRIDASSKPLRGAYMQYWLNHSYVIGEQWLWINSQTSGIDRLPQDPDRVQATVNHIWPASRTVIGKLTQRPLQFYVPPTGADDAKVRGARTSEAILTHLHREQDWEGKREDAYWAAWKGGTGALCIDWDPTAGEPLGMTEAGRRYGTGDVTVEALAITDFAIEPGAREGETARWWIKKVALPPEQVQATFQMDEAPEPDANNATQPYQRKLIQTHLFGDSNEDHDTPLTMCYTLYERPNHLCEEGRIVTIVNDEIVAEKDWDFPFKDRLNLVLIRETRVENTWIGETVLKAARPVQNAINQSWSSIIEHMKLAGNARLVLPESMIDQIGELTDLPGEILWEADGSATPKFLSPPQMPQWWVDEPSKLKHEMDDILGTHEVSRGMAPGRVESGLGISILAEQDATPINRITKDSAGAFGRLATMALQFYADKVKESRSATIKSPGQPPREYDYSGKDLHGQVVAEVPFDAIMPRSKAAQQAFADRAMQMGLINSLPEWFRLAEVPVERDILEVLSPDVAKARRENASMALGRVEIPEKFDDHAMHIQEHLIFMKSAEWDLMDDEQKGVFEDHNLAHETAAAAEMGDQRAKANVDPALAAAPNAEGAPLLPLAEAGGAPPMDMLPADELVTPESLEPDLASMVAQDFPGIDPGIIDAGLGM
jgi:hypothetical protein